MINTTWKTAVHLVSILAAQRPITSVTMVHRNDCRADSKFFTGQAVVRLSVKGGVGQNLIKVNGSAGLQYRRSKTRSVIVRSSGHDATKEQMRLGVTHGRHLRPSGVMIRTPALALKIIGADMMGLEAGAVDSSLGLIGDHLQVFGPVKNGVQEAFKSPFFSRRRSA